MSRKIARRLLIVGATTSTLVALIGAFLAGTPDAVDVAYAAACKGVNLPGCVQGYRTAAVDVEHVVPGGVSDTPVEPDDGETWNITAYWNTAIPICREQSETASVTVSWTGSGWALSGKSTTTHILDIDVCDTDDFCDTEDTHSYGYRLIAKVVDPLTLGYNLRQVVFTTTSVDDGYELDTSACTLGTGVSPTAQSFSATDSGAWECGYSCNNSGTTLQLTYE